MRPTNEDLVKNLIRHLNQLSNTQLRIVYQFVLHLIK